MNESVFLELLRNLHARETRFVLIGVAGANYYATRSGSGFYTKDRDLFLPPDPANLLNTWQACDQTGLDLWAGPEPLDVPRDLWLAEQVVARRGLTRARNAADLIVDLTLVMGGFEFETVWQERRKFRIEGVEIPVARLEHIVESKRAAGRKKDVLFLETWAQALDDLLSREARDKIDPPRGDGG